MLLPKWNVKASVPLVLWLDAVSCIMERVKPGNGRRDKNPILAACRLSGDSAGGKCPIALSEKSALVRRRKKNHFSGKKWRGGLPRHFYALRSVSPQSIFWVASRLVRKRGILPNVGRTFSLLDHEMGDIFSRNRSNSG